MNPGKNDTTRGFGRRDFLNVGSAVVTAALAAGGAAGQTSEKPNDIERIEKAQHDRSASDAGPEDTKVRDAQPNSFMPPPTDHGETPEFWNTFSAQHRRIQEGGWSRQVTVRDFPISKDIAGVNMRLTPGGIRELHWHATGEWAIMLSGKARITVMDDRGRGFVDDVGKDDLWYFPKGDPHSIQGLEPDGCEFLLVFDDGAFSETDTTLLSDWTRHTPREVLAKNWNLPESAIAPIYDQPPEGHYIFQRPAPPSLEEDRRAIAGKNGLSPLKFSFSLSKMAPTIQTRSGEARIVDSTNFPVSTTIAAAHVRVKPGGLRELHWHQNVDEWTYFISGQSRMTVFFNGSKARTADFLAGDVALIPKTFGHYIENTGNEDLVFLEMFRTDRFMDLSLSEWLTQIPPELVTQHLGIGSDIIAKIPKEKKVIVPA